jgi:SAM-dependent methyltransferase
MVTRKPADILGSKINFDQWLTEAPTVGDWARTFYREYVGISDEEELKQHLMDVRNKAWKVYRYRCVASFYFVNYNLSEAYGEDLYSTILQRLRNGEQFLDLGCAFGLAARNLVYDGAPVDKILSGDLRPEFWELGYELFRDRDKFHGKFRQGDIFDSGYLNDYEGKIDILHISAVFHLFDLPQQKELVKQLVRLLSTKSGSVIVGRMAGNTVPYYRENPIRPGQVLYQHNEESFRKMFEEAVGGDGWNLELNLGTRPENVADNGGLHGRLRFIITRT